MPGSLSCHRYRLRESCVEHGKEGLRRQGGFVGNRLPMNGSLLFSHRCMQMNADNRFPSPSPPRSGGEGRGEVVLRAQGAKLRRFLKNTTALVSAVAFEPGPILKMDRIMLFYQKRT